MREKASYPTDGRSERIVYLVVSKRHYSRELGAYRSCDIVACDMRSCTVAARVRDVTTDSELALRMVELLNRGRLAPIHLAEVIDDMLQK